MRKEWHRKAIGMIIIVIVAFSQWEFAKAGLKTQAEGEELVVAIKSIPPFVIIKDERISGFSIDLWEEIAQQMEMPFEYVVVDTVEDQLQMITAGDADLAIAAITINSEREDLLDFSYPYYQSGLQIMTPTGGGQVARNLLSVVLSPRALQIILAFALTMFILGNLVWFLERRKNSLIAHIEKF